MVRIDFTTTDNEAEYEALIVNWILPKQQEPQIWLCIMTLK